MADAEPESREREDEPNRGAEEPTNASDDGSEKTLTLRGACDASALEVLDDGALLVALDEGTNLTTWNWEDKGNVRSEYDLAPPLEKMRGAEFDRKDGVVREFDLEGVARVGDALFWVGSHSRSGKKGKKRENRRVLFATSVPKSGDLEDVEIKGRDRSLFGALQDLGVTELQEAKKKKPKEGGVNVEGLAVAEGGGLLLGFRSPLDAEGKALVVHLKNPEGFLMRGEEADMSPLWLDLDGRGIRGMLRWEAGYLILSGPAVADDEGEAPGPKLRFWNGRDEATVELSHEFPTGFRPEGIAADGDRLVVVSDDGAITNKDGTECKNLEVDDNKSFRVVRFKPPAVNGL